LNTKLPSWKRSCGNAKLDNQVNDFPEVSEVRQYEDSAGL